MGVLRVHARRDGHGPALRQALRHLRSPSVLPARHRALLDRVDHLRPLDVDGDAHRRTRDPGPWRGRAHPARGRRHRRHHPASAARKVAGLHGSGLRRVVSPRPRRRRLADGQRFLAVVLLREPSARRARARRGLVRFRAPARAGEAHDRLRRRAPPHHRRVGRPAGSSLGRNRVPVELADRPRSVLRRRRALDRVHPLGAANGGAHPSARPLRGPDVLGRHRRVLLRRRSDVRRNHLRAALRPAGARRERLVIGCRPHPPDARDHHDEHRRGPVSSPAPGTTGPC